MLAQVLAGKPAGPAAASGGRASGRSSRSSSPGGYPRGALGSTSSPRRGHPPVGDSSGLKRGFSRNTLKWEAQLVANDRDRND